MDRYRYLEGKFAEIPDRLEIYINSDGTLEANGMVPSDIWKRLFKKL
ncbi:MAG TPA: hypothetical protein VK057_03730 [Bacillota bacterium]|nr:hypothetical protein [Compostibacillus humi]HLT55193.1 hypothetical protein [Bacillota bacterium]